VTRPEVMTEIVGSMLTAMLRAIECTRKCTPMYVVVTDDVAILHGRFDETSGWNAQIAAVGDLIVSLGADATAVVLPAFQKTERSRHDGPLRYDPAAQRGLAMLSVLSKEGLAMVHTAWVPYQVDDQGRVTAKDRVCRIGLFDKTGKPNRFGDLVDVLSSAINQAGQSRHEADRTKAREALASLAQVEVLDKGLAFELGYDWS
jgi:hypothetical protein